MQFHIRQLLDGQNTFEFCKKYNNSYEKYRKRLQDCGGLLSKMTFDQRIRDRYFVCMLTSWHRSIYSASGSLWVQSSGDFHVTGLLWDDSPHNDRPVTRSYHTFLDIRLNKGWTHRGVLTDLKSSWRSRSVILRSQGNFKWSCLSL